MPGPLPKDPEIRQRKNKSATKAVLSIVVNPEIPEMPPASDWLPSIWSDSDKKPDDHEEPSWNPAVERWWCDIWSSPMSNEFHESDVHGLYLACFYLQQTLNPYLKMSDRISASKSYEAAVKNFGLTPMSRRTLQWEIERSEEAMRTGAKKRGAETAAQTAANRQVTAGDPREAEDEDDQNPFDNTPVAIG